MSVRLNLLPDIRQQRLREQRRRQLATLVGIIVCSVAGGVVIILLLVNGGQKLAISSNNKKIDTNKATLAGTKGLLDAMTAQQHLSSLPDLYKQRVYFSKFFTAYSQIAPTELTLDSVNVDATNTMKITGESTSYTSVTKLATAMQAENVTYGPTASAANDPYFTNIAISQVSKDDTGKVLFTLTATVGSGAVSAN